MPRKHTRPGVGLFVIACSASLLFGPAGARAEVKKSELRKQMEQMDESMKKLKRTVRKAEFDKETLELIGHMEQVAVTCKSMTPSKAASVPEADRAKFIAGYQMGMASLLSDMCQLEIAVLKGDQVKAHDLYKKLKDDEDKGHDAFMPDEDKDSAKEKK
jgi:hypothetical protein